MFSGKKILIVDDSNFERKIIIDSIKELGFHILEASNAADGIKIAEQELPSIILMDVVMPGMNGFQATKQLSLNKDLCHIPIIMCTSKNQPTDKMWADRQGAKGYIIKPINKKELIDLITKVLS